MSLIHYNSTGGWFPFPHLHGVLERGPISVPVQTVIFPGVIGVAHLIDPGKDREIRCQYTLGGYATSALLADGVNQIAYASGKYLGTLQRFNDSGALQEQEMYCTFLGFVPDMKPMYSAGGYVGWFQRGTLFWSQRKVY